MTCIKCLSSLEIGSTYNPAINFRCECMRGFPPSGPSPSAEEIRWKARAEKAERALVQISLDINELLRDHFPLRGRT